MIEGFMVDCWELRD
jgi:hypothetical protein